MTFFNKKEEVFSFELNSYGRSLLMEGKLKPVYYSFSDEEVLYNCEFADFSEQQNEIKDRIIEETPYIKKVPFVPAISQSQTFKNNKNPKQPQIISSIRSMNNSLGSITPNSDKTPEMRMVILEGENIKTFSRFYQSVTSSNGYSGLLDIPQLNCDLTYNTTVLNSEQPEYIPGTTFLESFKLFGSLESTANLLQPTLQSDRYGGIYTTQTSMYEDGGMAIVEQKQATLYINEENSDNNFENFEVEVYEILEEIDSITNLNKLRPLKFLKTLEDLSVDNNLLKSEQELSRLQKNINSIALDRFNIDNSYVEYYFDILTDTYSEISTDELCSLISQVKTDKLGFGVHFDCPDIPSINEEQKDIYYNIVEDKKC